MAYNDQDNNADVIAAAALAVTLIVCFFAVVGYYVTRRSLHVSDVENKPLLSDNGPIIMYDNDASTSTETVTAEIVHAVETTILPNARLSVSPTALKSGATTSENGDKNSTGAQTSAPEPSVRRTSPAESISISPVLSRASETANTIELRAKPIEVRQVSAHGEPSKARLGLDGALEDLEITGRSVGKVIGLPSSSLLDRFLPPQGLVEAMKAKLKTSNISEATKESTKPQEKDTRLVDTTLDDAHAVKLYTVTDAANDPTDPSIYDIKLGNHKVAPLGAFPISPKGLPKENEDTADTMKQTPNLMGSKVPKRRRQASKSDETTSNSLAPSATPKTAEKPATKVRVVASQYAQATKKEQARHSSAPEAEKRSGPAGNSMSKSQCRRHQRKKSHSVAALMKRGEEQAPGGKD